MIGQNVDVHLSPVLNMAASPKLAPASITVQLMKMHQLVGRCNYTLTCIYGYYVLLHYDDDLSGSVSISGSPQPITNLQSRI